MRVVRNAQNGFHLNRRGFLRASAAAAGGLLVSLYVDLPAFAQEGKPKVSPPDAFVHIKPNGQIVIMVNFVELGQGVHTSLPMLLAEELDADWSQVVGELAPAADVYKVPLFGLQITGGSLSIPQSFQRYRELGARTRAMLVAAAAERWQVAAEQCRTESSVVYGPANQSARYAELARDAVRQPVPDKVSLKNPSEFRLIGKAVRRLDGRAKCDGSQKFGLDRDLPGMKIAVIARPPVFGARVKGLDDREARSIAGVHDVFEIPLVKGSAVAVVADRFWTAKQARERLKIEWDLSGVERADSAELRGRYKKFARTTGKVAVNRGDEKAMARIPAANRIVAEYEFPYLAHASMEPLNMTLRFDGDRRIDDVRRPEVGEVRLLHLAVLQRDGPVRHQLYQAETDAALKLAFDRQRVHRQAAVKRNRHAVNSRALVLDRDLGRACDAGLVILVAGNSHRMAPRKLLTPGTLLFQQGQCVAQFAGVGVKQLEAIGDGIDLGPRGQFIDQRLHDERVVRVANGAPRQHRHIDGRVVCRYMQVRNPVFRIRRAFDDQGVDAILDQDRSKQGTADERLPDHDMPPGEWHAVGVDADFDPMREHRTIVARAHIVLAREDKLDRRAGQTLGDRGRFALHVGVQNAAPAEAAAGEFDVKGDLLRF